MRRLLFLMVSSFVIICSNAQSDFRKGFIVLNSNDTVYGLINYKGDISNSKQCVFKKNETSLSTEYKPSDIICYRFIDDKFFVSKEITIEGIKEKVFLEFLIHGIVDVFCFYNESGMHYYAQKRGQDMIELKEIEKEVYLDNTRYIKKDKQYIYALKYIFSDVPAIQKEAENTILSRNSLIDISKDYHSQVCSGESCIIYEKRRSKMKLSIGPLVGYRIVSIDPENYNNSGYYYSRYFSKSKNASFGLYTNFSFPFLNEKCQLQYELEYTSTKFESDYIDSWVNDTIDFSISTTKLYHTILFKYDMFKWKFRPVLNIGGFTTQNINDLFSGLKRNRSTGEVVSFINRSYIGFICGIDFTYRITEKRDVFLQLLCSKGFGNLGDYNTTEYTFKVGIPIFIHSF